MHRVAEQTVMIRMDNISTIIDQVERMGGYVELVQATPEECIRMDGKEASEEDLDESSIIMNIFVKDSRSNIDTIATVANKASLEPSRLVSRKQIDDIATIATVASKVTPEPFKLLSEEEIAIVLEKYHETPLPESFLSTIQLIDFLVFQMSRSFPKKYNKEKKTELLAVLREVAKHLKAMFYAKNKKAFLQSALEPFFRTAQSYFERFIHNYRQSVNNPPPICNILIHYLSGIFEERDSLLESPLFSPLQMVVGEAPQSNFSEKLAPVIEYLGHAALFQKKSIEELSTFYSIIIEKLRKIHPDEEGAYDFSSFTRECFTFGKATTDWRGRITKEKITPMTLYRFRERTNGLMMLAELFSTYGKYSWKLSFDRWRTYLNEFFERSDSPEKPFQYQDSRLFSQLEKEIDALEEELTAFIFHHYECPFFVFSKNYKANKKLFDQLPQAVCDSFRSSVDLIVPFFEVVQQKMEAIKINFLELRYSEEFSDDDLNLIPIVIEELTPQLAFLTMILRDSETLFGLSCPKSEAMEDLFSPSFLALIKLNRHTQKLVAPIEPHIEEVSMGEKKGDSTTLSVDLPTISIAPVVEPKLRSEPVFLRRVETAQEKTRFSSEEAHAQFNFEELVLLEKREKTTLYLDPTSQKNIEVFETETVQEKKSEGVSLPLKKFRDVFKDHFPQLKDRNVQAEDIKALLKSDSKFKYHHSTGGHDIFEILATQERFPVPKGNQEGVLAPGTLNNIRASMLKAIANS